MKKLRVSIVQYLNTAPLVWGFTNGPLRGKYDLSFTLPSQCAEALRSGAADIAIIPAIEYQRIDDLVILPGMAIASKNRVRSLLIVSKTPIESARTIALDASSRSTQALTKILCAQKWKNSAKFIEMQPDLHTMLQNADAALLIGDPALRLSLLGVAGEGKLHVYDVVEQWRQLTNLPAVLAVWAARRESVTPAIVEDFQASRDLGMQHLDEISRQAAIDLALPAEQLQQYLTENIDFALDEQNLQGLQEFFRRSAALNLIPRMTPISIASASGSSVIPARMGVG